MKPKRIALSFLIVSVALGAIMGIIGLISGRFGDLQSHIILTTISISGASICALACGALWESRHAKVLPFGGIALSLITAGLFIFGVWARISGSGYWKFAASVGIVAVATAHMSLLSLAILARRFAWSRVVAFVAVYILAVLFIYVIYYSPQADTTLRVVGVTSIIVAALSIMTPIFHRLSLSESVPSPHQSISSMSPMITCPRCGAALPNSLTEISCTQCGCTFLVTIIASSETGAA